MGPLGQALAPAVSSHRCQSSLPAILKYLPGLKSVLDEWKCYIWEHNQKWEQSNCPDEIAGGFIVFFNTRCYVCASCCKQRILSKARVDFDLCTVHLVQFIVQNKKCTTYIYIQNVLYYIIIVIPPTQETPTQGLQIKYCPHCIYIQQSN